MLTRDERDRLLVQIVENSPVSMVTFDEDQVITYANKYHSTLYGYGREEIVGRPVHRLSAADDPEAFYRAAVAVARRHGIWRGEDERRKKDGSRFPSSSSITRLEDDEGRFLCYFEASREIWDRAARDENLRRISYRDPLTGAANRRAFDEAYEREWTHTRTRGLPISLLMVDIDFFKRFNDTYGHLAGDDCLVDVARAVEGVVRANDVVARFGGEEFVVMLAATPAPGAALVAEKIRAAVEAIGRRHDRSEAARVVTVSVGAATVVPRDETLPSELIAAADAALYRAKDAGRNRVAADDRSER